MDFHFSGPQTTIEELFGGFYCINACGKISSGDYDKFVGLIEKCKPPPRCTVYVDSTGGDVSEAIKIGRMIRKCWFSTSVGQYLFDFSNPSRSTIVPRVFVPGNCMSAATLLFLGGRLRYLNKESKFGVHQFSFSNAVGSQIPRHYLASSQTTSAAISEYVAEMGVSLEFLTMSASVPSDEMKLIDYNTLEGLSVLTGGQTPAKWTIEANKGISYVKGERDTVFGHQKLILGFQRDLGFFIWAVIETQGRETELLNFKLVEITINGEELRVDISTTVSREAYGIYTHLLSPISENVARQIAYSVGFGMQVRFSAEAEVFLGVGDMETNDGSEKLRTFFENHRA